MPYAGKASGITCNRCHRNGSAHTARLLSAAAASMAAKPASLTCDTWRRMRNLSYRASSSSLSGNSLDAPTCIIHFNAWLHYDQYWSRQSYTIKQTKGWLPTLKHACGKHSGTDSIPLPYAQHSFSDCIKCKEADVISCLGAGTIINGMILSTGGSPSTGEELALCLCHYQIAARSRQSEACSK